MDVQAALRSPEFWRQAFPDLTIAASRGLEPEAHNPFDVVAPAYRERMLEEGYFQGRSAHMARMAPRLAAAVRTLRRRNMPLAFLFVFDETWEMFGHLMPVINPLLNDVRVLPDFWVWHVDPAANESGWSPHVDKGIQALDKDGRPLSLTAWIPLSRSTPQNGCMYMIPANRDPEYGAKTNERTKPVGPTLARALPGEPGDFFIWNQAVLHWGSGTSRFADEPRISMALEFQTNDIPPFNEPLIGSRQIITFEDRLKLVGKQILQYRHMYKVEPTFEKLAEALIR